MNLRTRYEALQDDLRKQSILSIVVFLVLATIIVGLCSIVIVGSFEPKGRVNCDSFGPYGTQQDAKDAYERALAAFSGGAFWLDGANGLVGIPCEKIYRRAYPKGQDDGE